MTKEQYILLTGWLLAAAVFCFAWSTALTLLQGRSLNSMAPWAVFSFMVQYGMTGSAGSLLLRSFLMAFATAGVLVAAVMLTRSPTWYGDARWATGLEISRARLRQETGLLLGKTGRAHLINDEPLHALVAAPTRSGKGVGIVIPNLLTWNGSVVMLDIKKENYQLTAGHRAQHQKVYLWSPLDDRSACYNPLDFIAPGGATRITDIQKLGQILLPRPERGDTMWVNEAQSLFLGLVLLVLDDRAQPSTLGQVYRILMGEGRLNKIAEESLDIPNLDPAAHAALANFKNKADKERSGVKSNLTAALALWANPNIDTATARSDFNLRDFRRVRSSVYVGVGQDQLLTLAPLLNMFFQQAVSELSHSLPAADEPHDVLFLIDEFPMLGPMPTLQKGLALLAGYKIRIVLITQGVGQLEEIYGPQATEGILQNCALQVFFASNDDKTTTYVSQRLGSRTVQVRSRSQSQDWTSGTTSISYIARPLLPPEEVRRLSPKKAIIFKETTRPILAEKVRYYSDRTLAARAGAPAPKPPVKNFLLPAPTTAHQAVAELAEIIELPSTPPPDDPPPAPPADATAPTQDSPTFTPFRATFVGAGEERRDA